MKKPLGLSEIPCIKGHNENHPPWGWVQDLHRKSCDNFLPMAVRFLFFARNWPEMLRSVQKIMFANMHPSGMWMGLGINFQKNMFLLEIK